MNKSGDAKCDNMDGDVLKSYRMNKELLMRCFAICACYIH